VYPMSMGTTAALQPAAPFLNPYWRAFRRSCHILAPGSPLTFATIGESVPCSNPQLVPRAEPRTAAWLPLPAVLARRSLQPPRILTLGPVVLFQFFQSCGGHLLDRLQAAWSAFVIGGSQIPADLSSLAGESLAVEFAVLGLRRGPSTRKEALGRLSRRRIGRRFPDAAKSFGVGIATYFNRSPALPRPRLEL
jgi:hypothetical protein